MIDMTTFQALASLGVMMITYGLFLVLMSKYNRESSLIIERAIRETE